MRFTFSLYTSLSHLPTLALHPPSACSPHIHLFTLFYLFTLTLSAPVVSLPRFFLTRRVPWGGHRGTIRLYFLLYGSSDPRVRGASGMTPSGWLGDLSAEENDSQTRSLPSGGFLCVFLGCCLWMLTFTLWTSWRMDGCLDIWIVWSGY